MDTNEENMLRPLKRVRYFNGMLLSEKDFTVDQQYLREKQKLHNKFLHGSGVVAGLEVSVNEDSADEFKVEVTPGLAIDPEGNEIIVPQPVSITCDEIIRSGNNTTYVFLYYEEHETDQVPLVDGEAKQYSRIEESYKIEFETDSSLSKDENCESIRQERVETGGVPLARLKLEQGHWKLDATFQRPCIKN
jgi:hypothetical protein